MERAHRAKVLIDGAAYFGGLRAALLRAEHCIFIVGWDIDSRTALRGDAETPDDGAPVRLREFLSHLVARKPELQIHLLPWDFSVLFALEREPLPILNLEWLTPPQIKVCLDDVLPLGGAHHQKIVVIDDALAFSGGLDLTQRRWDKPAHAVDEPLRRDPAGRAYPPFHDVQICVDGEAAQALGELVRERWLRAACEPVEPAKAAGDPWPPMLEPDFREVDVAIARTAPADGEGEGVREVAALFDAAIQRARRSIYIENQFLTAVGVADALAERMRRQPQLEALLVGPKDHVSWLEARSMKAGRIRFFERLRAAGVADRARLVYPVVGDGSRRQPVNVHAKVMIVDDGFLRVGSANLNNRSMGTDTECDLAIAARDATEREAIAGVRNRLLAEHLGASESAVAESLRRTGSLLATVDALGRAERRLESIDDRLEIEDALSEAVSGLADPERPIAASRLVGDVFEGEPSNRVAARIVRLLLAGGLLLAAALAWRFVHGSSLLGPVDLGAWLHILGSSPWAHLLLPLIYVLGGLVWMPVTVLIGLTAIALTPGWAFFHAGLGSLLSAAALYWLGACLGRRYLHQKMGMRLNRVSRGLARKGVRGVIAIRIVPLAPFTLVNLVAGASHIRFSDFLLGTAVGMAPGILTLTAMGHQLARILTEPSAGGIALLALAVLLWICLSLGLQAFVLRVHKAA